MKQRKKLLVLVMFLIAITNNLCAQAQVISKFTAFRDNWMRPLYPIVIAIVFLGGALFNIGLVWGENKEWKTFFTKIGIFLLAATIIVGVFEAVMAITV